MDLVSFARMSNVLDQTKQQQVLALGRLGWPASRIAAAVQVDRATVTGYLRAAGLAFARPGRPRKGAAKPAISPEVSTTGGQIPQFRPRVVSTDSALSRAPRASACRLHRERIEAAVWLAAMRWRFGRTWSMTSALRPAMPVSVASSGSSGALAPPEARVVIATTPGQEAQVDYGEGPMVRQPGDGEVLTDAALCSLPSHTPGKPCGS